MISQLAQFGARRGRIRHPDRSFWKQKRRCLNIFFASTKIRKNLETSKS